MPLIFKILFQLNVSRDVKLRRHPPIIYFLRISVRQVSIIIIIMYINIILSIPYTRGSTGEKSF